MIITAVVMSALVPGARLVFLLPDENQEWLHCTLSDPMSVLAPNVGEHRLKRLAALPPQQKRDGKAIR